jgi:hypothetical protein
VRKELAKALGAHEGYADHEYRYDLDRLKGQACCERIRCRHLEGAHAEHE